MRVFIPSVGLLAVLVGCGQKLDIPAAAASCDPATMNCSHTPLEGGTADGNEAGASSSSDQTAAIQGRVIGFADDYFDQGVNFAAQARVSADGRNGARVSGLYDGSSFQLDDALKTAVNWFLTEPATNSGFLPTLIPVDTRSVTTDQLLVAVAPQTQVEEILQGLGTEPSAARAQIIVHVIDNQRRSVTGVTAEVTAEVTAYRTAGAWLGGAAGTDDSGLILLGNAPVGSALSRVSVVLSGNTSARIDVDVLAGATTVVTAVVTPK